MLKSEVEADFATPSLLSLQSETKIIRNESHKLQH